MLQLYNYCLAEKRIGFVNGMESVGVLQLRTSPQCIFLTFNMCWSHKILVQINTYCLDKYV